MSKDDIPCQACVRTITKKPGLKETNFQVGGVRLPISGQISTEIKVFNLNCSAITICLKFAFPPSGSKAKSGADLPLGAQRQFHQAFGHVLSARPGGQNQRRQKRRRG